MKGRPLPRIPFPGGGIQCPAPGIALLSVRDHLRPTPPLLWWGMVHDDGTPCAHVHSRRTGNTPLIWTVPVAEALALPVWGQA